MSKHPGVRFGPFEIRPADPEVFKIYDRMKANGEL